LSRSLFSAALIVLLSVALAWGNCATCTKVIPGRAESHDCCDKDQAPKPAKSDCAGTMVDFAKAAQPDNSKAPIVLADAGTITAAVVLASTAFDSGVAAPSLAGNASHSATPLRI
jgi:hypothetical protein